MGDIKSNALQEAEESLSLKMELQKYKEAIENKNDYIIWLFEESGHINHITQHETWDEYEKWKETQ